MVRLWLWVGGRQIQPNTLRAGLPNARTQDSKREELLTSGLGASRHALQNIAYAVHPSIPFLSHRAVVRPLVARFARDRTKTSEMSLLKSFVKCFVKLLVKPFGKLLRSTLSKILSKIFSKILCKILSKILNKI